MTLTAFRTMVEANAAWFQGVHPESEATLDESEHALGIRLPSSLRWLLRVWGYSAACGVDSLAEAVAATRRCRIALGLPSQYMVLNDWGDAGIVLMETSAGTEPEKWPIHWMGTHNLGKLAAGGPIDADHDRYDGFGEWVRARLALAIEETA